MPDYKALYFALFRANAAAADVLLRAQTDAEQSFLKEEASPPLVLWEGEKPQSAQGKGTQSAANPEPEK